MAQSCGRWTARQGIVESGLLRPGGSPLKKRQPSLKARRRWPESWMEVAAGSAAQKMAIIRPGSRKWWNFMGSEPKVGGAGDGNRTRNQQLGGL